MVDWPAALPNFLVDGFTYDPVSNGETVEVESGEPVSFEEFTGDTAIISGSFLFSASELVVFHAWWRDDLKHGTLTFSLDDPLFSEPATMQFTSTPKYTYMGGPTRVDVQLRVLDTTDLEGDGGGGGPSSFSFNMTAGNFFGIIIGYQQAAYGSIDVEPIFGHDLVSLSSGIASQFVFDGDITSLVVGLTVWVDGVDYGTGLFGFVYGGSTTTLTWFGTGPTFVNGISYLVEIR